MVISADQFNVLQKARSKLGPFINDTSEALNPSYPLARRRQKVTEVIDRYKGKFPEPIVSPGYLKVHPQLARQYENTVKNTVTKELTDLKPNMGGGASMVAGDYLGTVTLIHGLADFEAYVSQHTSDEGLKSNPADPMPILEGGASKGFGNGELRGYVSIGTSVDAASGVITYRLVGEEVTEASVSRIENEFVTQALGLLQEGDNFLLDWTKL